MPEATEEVMTSREPLASVELLDPKSITPRNTRTPKLNERFLNSIREFGVLQPIRVVRDPSGALFLRFGDRRRLACIELGLQVPAIIVNATVNTTSAEIDRIFEQLAENDDRDGYTAGEHAAAVQELLDLNVEVKIITRKTGLGKDEIAAARKIAASEKARTLAAQYPLDIPQTAAIAEFDGDEAAVEELVEAAQEGQGRFRQALQRARDERRDREMIGAHAAKLEAEGFVVNKERLPYENAVEYWADNGKQLTPETHKDCPGHVVHLSMHYSGSKVHETWMCTDPKEYGHKRHRAGTGTGQTPEEAAAERSRVLAGNKDWRSAEKVRRDWLRDFLARPKIPAGALMYVLKAFARSDGKLRYAMDHRESGQHATARDLLGLTRDKGPGWSAPPEVYTALANAGPERAQVIALGIVLGALEGATDVHSWRSPGEDTADYLETLASWGYDLSDIERELVAGARKRQADAAVAATERETARVEG